MNHRFKDQEDGRKSITEMAERLSSLILQVPVIGMSFDIYYIIVFS